MGHAIVNTCNHRNLDEGEMRLWSAVYPPGCGGRERYSTPPPTLPVPDLPPPTKSHDNLDTHLFSAFAHFPPQKGARLTVMFR